MTAYSVFGCDSNDSHRLPVQMMANAPSQCADHQGAEGSEKTGPVTRWLPPALRFDSAVPVLFRGACIPSSMPAPPRGARQLI